MASIQQVHKNHYSPKIAIPIIALSFVGALSLALVLMIVLWV